MYTCTPSHNSHRCRKQGGGGGGGGGAQPPPPPPPVVWFVGAQGGAMRTTVDLEPLPLQKGSYYVLKTILWYQYIAGPEVSRI